MVGRKQGWAGLLERLILPVQAAWSCFDLHIRLQGKIFFAENLQVLFLKRAEEFKTFI